VSKKLYRQSSAFVCGVVFHYQKSAGSEFNFCLISFLVIQLSLVMLLEAIEQFAYTSKIDVSLYFCYRVCFTGHQEADEIIRQRAVQIAWSAGSACRPG
jgi:hypothetical protein